jgi:hypothetical protein
MRTRKSTAISGQNMLGDLATEKDLWRVLFTQPYDFRGKTGFSVIFGQRKIKGNPYTAINGGTLTGRTAFLPPCTRPAYFIVRILDGTGRSAVDGTRHIRRDGDVGQPYSRGAECDEDKKQISFGHPLKVLICSWWVGAFLTCLSLLGLPV